MKNTKGSILIPVLTPIVIAIAAVAGNKATQVTRWEVQEAMEAPRTGGSLAAPLEQGAAHDDGAPALGMRWIACIKHESEPFGFADRSTWLSIQPKASVVMIHDDACY